MRIISSFLVITKEFNNLYFFQDSNGVEEAIIFNMVPALFKIISIHNMGSVQGL
jgi:hypothetical protein